MRKLLFIVGLIAGCMFLLVQNKAQTSSGIYTSGLKCNVMTDAGVKEQELIRRKSNGVGSFISAPIPRSSAKVREPCKVF